MDLGDLLRKFKWKRELDNKGISFRKTVIIVLFVIACFLYWGPYLFRWLFSGRKFYDPMEQSVSDRADYYAMEALSFDANVRYLPPRPDEDSINVLHFVGNGYVGSEFRVDSPLYIKRNKVLSVPVPFQPVLSIDTDEGSLREAAVLQYATGTARKIQSAQVNSKQLDVTQELYAHQEFSSLLVQEVKITNPSAQDATFRLTRGGLSKWPTSVSYTHKLQHVDGEYDYLVISGALRESSRQMVTVIVTTKVATLVEVSAKSSVTERVLTVTLYEVIRDNGQYATVKDRLEKDAIKEMSAIIRLTAAQLKSSHVEVWRQLFSTGLSISTSKAAGAINGDRINATLYLTLSQNLAKLRQLKVTQQERDHVNSHLAYTEGCYGGHHTLQAAKLWTPVSTMEEMVKVTSLWLRTLETQGCHKLVRMGAEGVMQAMLLSFGSIKFSNQHLEFNTEPKDLHRDFHYRRINYGNATHLNISVAVLEDNKAALYVALDRSDKEYYACDGGCLDPPVQLGPVRSRFPVKLTEPVTAVLYITSDKPHMEDLKHTIHVKEVAEAPAHENHVIALHKHGHHLGGMPAFFWTTFSLLIILFHLFLFRLIYNEYCGGIQTESKVSRSRKFSDL